MFFIFLIPVIIGVPLAIAFLVHRAVKPYHHKRAIVAGVLTFITPYIIISAIQYIDFTTYDEHNVFYADEISTYETDFKAITTLELPASADFESTNTIFPYFKREYMTSGFIQVSLHDFKNLVSKVKKSSKLIQRSDAMSETYQLIKNKTGNQDYIYSASSTIENEYHFIGFCEDQKTVIIHRIKW